MEEKKKEIAMYLRNTVSPFVTPLMEEMVRKRPTDIFQFAKDYLENLIQKRQSKPKQEQSDQDNESQQNEEFAKKLEMRRKGNKGKKISRQGISAEVYGIFNKKEDFIPKVIEKDTKSKEAIMKLIKKSILFENLADQDINIVADAMTIQNFQQEQIVIREGDQGQVLYVVGSGDYSCSKVINGQETYLKTYKVGEYFGELALMYTAPRAASITCSKAGILYGLDRQTFKHIVQESANKRRQKFTQILSSVSILSEIDPYQKEQLCDILKEEIFEAGDFIVNEGEEGNKFYMIASGSLIAEKDSKKVFEFKEGDYFGEIALVRNTPRQASVKCLTKSRVLSIDRDAFKRMFGPIEEILKRNQEKYKHYIAA